MPGGTDEFHSSRGWCLAGVMMFFCFWEPLSWLIRRNLPPYVLHKFDPLQPSAAIIALSVVAMVSSNLCFERDEEVERRRDSFT